ncbi:MAG: MgtC/SapB family protein [Candidatus Azambacteria bacterium]|nr:MgtC/SapB family protein [Candidatus Azambacteria bacterium]
MIDMHQISMVISLLVATILGIIVGVEREFVRKEAGIKTYALVTLGAALFTVISFDPNFSDPSRIIAQIVTGIGFIGAGIIIFHQNKIHGLTTAAGLWVMAGVGIAVGMRQYALAVASTIIILFILFVLRKLKVEDRLHVFAGIKEEEEK